MKRLILALMALTACKGEPQPSYCEAVCDWAVSCAATEREVDEAALLETCLADARAADPTCADAEAGKINAATRKLLTTCTDAIDAAAGAGECDGFVGSVDDQKTATTPKECATLGADSQSTFEAARTATAETNEELCARFTETICVKLDECVLGDLGGSIPDAVVTAMGGTPLEICIQRLDPLLTAECVASGLYAPEESLTDVNTARQGARECLVGFSETTCEDLYAGSFAPECGAAFTSTEQSVEVAGALFTLAQDFQAAAE
jgi:hypothetical protein